MAETEYRDPLVDGIRPLSSFAPVEQRVILALVEAADAPPAAITPLQEAEIRKVAREAAREATREAIVSAIREGRLAVPGTAADHRATEGG
jgi:hypothetical protein